MGIGEDMCALVQWLSRHSRSDIARPIAKLGSVSDRHARESFAGCRPRRFYRRFVVATRGVNRPTPRSSTRDIGVEARLRVTRWNGRPVVRPRGDRKASDLLPPRESPPRRFRGVGGDGGCLRGGGRGVLPLGAPLGALTAAWWLGTGRGCPLSHHLRRDRERLGPLLRLEVSVEADDVVAGDRPADLILVHAGQREYAMEGCDNAARMVAERIAATVEHTTTRAASVVDIADLCSVGADEVARALTRGSRALAFVVESAVCTEDPSDELFKGARRSTAPSSPTARRRRRRVSLRRARGG